MLEAVNLYKTYQSENVDYQVLKNINLQIKQGDCVAIIGKSGSGKSTLMHLLACLDLPTNGNVYFDGEDFSTLNEKQKDELRNRKFGFVFQQFFLNGRETVFENVVLPMRIRGADQYDFTKNAMDALEAVGLKDKEEKRAKDLSGGEKQRVCIARALVGNPQVIFADEPTGNLDSKNGNHIFDLMTDLHDRHNVTLVLVTHDQNLADKAQRQVILKDGSVISDQFNNEENLSTDAHG